jgi:hypothetical protein
MAKSGRYSADRKKIEALTADKTVEVSDCGTVFTADASAGAMTITLPSAASAGKGWWCKVIVIAGSANDVTIGINGDQIYGLEVAAAGAGTAINSTNDLVLAGNLVGLQAELICDGSNWLALTHGNADADVTNA